MQVAVMASVNHPEDVKDVYDVISDHVGQIHKNQVSKDELISKTVLRMREAALKSHVIIGFPKVRTLMQVFFFFNFLLLIDNQCSSKLGRRYTGKYKILVTH